MRILVTGAGGFLGRHVARRLLTDGFEVTGFDLVTGSMPDISWVEGDLRDHDAVATAAHGHQLICHLGAIGDVYMAAEHPALAAQVNVVGCANVALAAEAVGAKVVYASTWEVYGEACYEPVDENHPCAPDHPYSITKLAGERILLAADRLRRVPVISLRLGTAYGPGLRPNSVFRIFVDKATRGEPITIQGDGLQGRQFTHASDLAGAFSSACRSGLHGSAFNVVAPEQITIKQLAEAVVARYPTEISFGDPRPGDAPPAMVSAEKARRLLGWEPLVSFEEGVAGLMDHLEGGG